jgi:DNA-binding transcriptional ArsR family regulator
MVKHEPSTSDAASTPLGPSLPNPDLPEDSTPPLDLDAVFAALGHPRRRHLLSALADRDGEQSLTRLATDVVARESDQPRESVSTEACQRCRIALHHAHLPKLDALGVVDYDPDGDPSVQAADTDQVEAVLNAVAGGLDTAPGTFIQRDGAY